MAQHLFSCSLHGFLWLTTLQLRPQISDFGLAKWLPDQWPHHVMFPIEGTFGWVHPSNIRSFFLFGLPSHLFCLRYLAPEYFMHGVVNEKTDVFAFGVLLLELITGRRAVDSSRQSLVIWVCPAEPACDGVIWPPRG